MFWRLSSDSILLILLRIVLITFLLLGVSLIVPELNLGGRYLVLLEAVLIAFSTQALRDLIGIRLPYSKRSVITGLCSIVILGLFKLIFIGVNLSITGILSLYSGAVLLELILPNRLVESLW